MTSLSRFAVLGAGHVGPVFARLAVDAGMRVTIAASGDPEDLALMMQVVLPEAEARWAADAVADADVVVMAIPLHDFTGFDPGLVAGKLVVDAMNHWAPADGVVEMFQDPRYSTSEVVQRRLAGSTVAKPLNPIRYQDLVETRRPPAPPGR